MQISRISYNDNEYPDRLRDLEGHHRLGSPKDIYYLGQLPDADEQLVAVVGTRKVSRYGEQVTYQLASELAKAGATIVSGLAYGADSIAIRAALDAGGRTIAVLGNPLDRISPSANRSLAKEILATGGCLITEYAVGTEVQKWFFSDRDRIIAALAQVTIVTESPAQGGSLITARDALEIGRNVMAVPGNITSETSAGTNFLIYKGAKLIRSYTDVVTDLGYHVREKVPVAPRSRDEATIVDLLKQGMSNNEQLIEASGFSASQFANVISLMEITGKVRNLGAGQWVIR